MNHSVLDELKKVGSFVHIFLPLSHLALLPTCCQRLKVGARVIVENCISICISCFSSTCVGVAAVGRISLRQVGECGGYVKNPGACRYLTHF